MKAFRLVRTASRRLSLRAAVSLNSTAPKAKSFGAYNTGARHVDRLAASHFNGVI